MPRASRDYCKKTPIKKMGFTQRSSCIAQGLIPRQSKTLKGKYVKSPKYRMNSNILINTSLYSSGKGKPKVKTGFANTEKAKMTLKNIKPHPIDYQIRVVNTMYNRAKYHPYQTKEMREAMNVFKKWLKKNL
jgi:hypothetical protein